MLAMALCLAGCHRPVVSCRSEFLYPPYLASAQVNTPDPKRGCFLGQQVRVFWDLPPPLFGHPLTLRLHVRYGNRTVETFTYPLQAAQGVQTYRLMNEEYACREGILSFQAEICQQGHVVAEWNHYLWKPILHIETQD